MMLYPSINELKTKTDSRYSLCILTAKRARDIIDNKPVLTEVRAERPVSLAANEIAEDLITYYRKEETEEVEDATFAEAVADTARFSVDEEPTEEVGETINEESTEVEPEEASTAVEE